MAKITGGLDIYSMREVPAWIEVDKGKFSGVIKDLPKRDDITAKVEERLVVEYYNK